MRRYLVLVPGLLGWLLVTSAAELATIWSSNAMFSQGWWGAMPHHLVYLVPGIVITLLATVPVRWPKAGGWFLGTVGVSLVIFWGQVSSDKISLEAAIPFVVAALMFIMEGWRLEQIERGIQKPFNFNACPGRYLVCRHPRLAVTLGLPLLTIISMALF